MMMFSPKDLSRAVFQWLLDGAYAEGVDSITPETLAVVIDGHGLTDREALALWCFCRAAAVVQPALSDRLARLRGSLEIGEELDRICDGAIRRVKPSQGRLARDLLAAPPVELAREVVEVVAQHTGNAGARPIALVGLKPVVFQHPKDRIAIHRFELLPIIPGLVGKAIDFFVRRNELVLLGNGIKVTERSLPQVHRSFRESCEALGLSTVPELYVAHGELNAYCAGGERMFVVVTSSVLDILDPVELRFVLGHELGHLMSGHARYHALGRYLATSFGMLSEATLGITSAVYASTVQPWLFNWYRLSEYTADRAGLLACQNREAALRAMTKVAGFPIRAYGQLRSRTMLEQAAEYRELLECSQMDRIRDSMLHSDLAHPFWTARVVELVEWIEDSSYGDILDSDQARLHYLAQLIDEDPMQQLLATQIIRTIARWAAKEYRVPRAVTSTAARHMVYERRAPTGTPLERIFRLELHATKEGPDTVTYSVIIAHIRDNGPVKTTVPIQYDAEWLAAPKLLREEYIRHGENKTIVRLLYDATDVTTRGAERFGAKVASR